MENQKCNCLEEVAEKLKAQILEQRNVQSVNYALISATVSTNRNASRAVIAVNASLCYNLKNGGTKNKQSTRQIIALFCPFCGIEY